MNATDHPNPPEARRHQAVLTLVSFLIIAVYALMIDLKGVSTDEGFRLGIINGGRTYLLNHPPYQFLWREVLQANQSSAYQPLYFLIQNMAMAVGRTQDGVFLKFINLGFLWVTLQGLLALARSWRLLPKLFLLGVFFFNAYLFMHVLQIREYILGVAFYVWSSWLVLRLLDLELRSLGKDAAWFTGYGLMLTLGFYTQTWVVFPAIAQGAFLLLRRKTDRLRFLGLLGISYLIVVAATLPYLLANPQKIHIGRWGQEGTSLWPQLSNGFHLVLTGHTAGHATFTDFLFCFWPAIIVAAVVVAVWGRARGLAPAVLDEFRQQGLLMLLSAAAPVAVQVYYALTTDNLSLWPRYFVVHYFFLFWLLALSFRCLHEAAQIPSLRPLPRRLLRAANGVGFALMLASACYQTASYYRDPYLDTGLNQYYDWRTLASGIAEVLQPDDVLLVNEFINRSTLTYTRPVPNQVVMLAELGKRDVRSVRRMVYLEPGPYLSQRPELAKDMAAHGFPRMEEVRIRTNDGRDLVREWRLLVFSRDH